MTRRTRLVIATLAVGGMALAAGPAIVATACGNLSALRALRAYYGRSTMLVPAPCPAGLVRRSPRAAWALGADLVQRGETARARDLLAGHLPALAAADRRQRLDQLLTLAAAPSDTDLAPVRAAMSLAREAGHDSALGYLAAGRFARGLADRGIPGALDVSREAFRLAGETTAPMYRNRVARSEAWFTLAQLWYGRDDQRALEADLAAIKSDPADDSGGFAWMAAMQAAEIHAARREWDEVRALLRTAARMPDLYHRHSHTALRLAQVEAGLGHPEAATTILEQAIASDPDFVPTRLALASLYRDDGRPDAARAQYEVVLGLEPGSREALRGLEELR